MHEIGQVLFVVLAKKNQVYPMQVVEVINKKTLKGEEVRYALQAGSDRSTNIYLDQLDGEVFDSHEKARAVLVTRATAQINRLIDAAVKKAEEWYGFASGDTHGAIPDITPIRKASEQKTSDVDADVMMPDGSLVKVKLPAA